MNKTMTVFLTWILILAGLGVAGTYTYSNTQFNIKSLGTIGAAYNFSAAALIINASSTSGALALDNNQIASNKGLFLDAQDDIRFRTNNPVESIDTSYFT